jgi:hypothetical protein
VSADHVIDADHPVPVGKEHIGQMASQETGDTGNENLHGLDPRFSWELGSAGADHGEGRE